MSNNGKKSIIIGAIFGILLLTIVIILAWFLNRKFDVTFDLDNGTKNEVVQVKYNKTINKKDVKDQKELGELFIGWYEVVDVKDKKDILAKKEFDFKTKINRNVKLKAVYEQKPKTITITFDSKGGSKVEPITINESAELILPKNPTYSGYTFKCWEDKNEKPIYNNVVLAEDTTLYAKWEKDESKKSNTKKDDSKKSNTKKEDQKKDKPKEVVYYCDSGYALDGTKCTKTETKNATGICPQGYSAGAWDYDYCTTEIDPEEEYRCIDKMGYKESEAVLDSTTNKCYYKKAYRQSNPIYCSSNGKVYYNGYCYYAQFDAEFITYCAGGVNVNSSGMCDLKMKKVFNCENGWTLENKKCTKTIVVDAKKK